MPRTELALFVEAFGRALAPLGARLEEVRASLSRLREELPSLAEPELVLADLQRELTALRQRVAAERATVFLFGPAKGGKSTLASALAGALQENVSSFPGYPCVQRLAHGSPAAELATFDGKPARALDLGGLELGLARQLGELAEAARDAAVRGQSFEPARDLPHALRRLSRWRPSEACARAALELVECPPIHGPLFSTYDAMLVGEADGARAAVFVLRAAHLADDTLFDGIEPLLATFPELFLVLNVDGRAQELAGTGTPVGALEREDPARLLDAFREATTSVVVFDALRAGRLRVLAIDLLEGTRARLAGEEERAPGRRARFGDLERELFLALDRHEARAAFVTSALRRTREVAGELAGLEAWPGFAPLAPALVAARAARQSLERRLAALDALGARPASLWAGEPVIGHLRERLARSAMARAEARAGELAGPFRAALEDWFASSESLAELCEARLAPRLAQAARELSAAHVAELASALSDARGVSLFSPAIAAEFGAAGLAPGELLGTPAALVPLSATLPRPLDVAAIPVKKGLAQRLALRSDDDARRALFGPDEAPTRALDSKEKSQRLGRELLTALRDDALARARTAFAESARLATESALEAVLDGFRAALAARLASERAALQAPLAAARAREEALALLVAALRALAHEETRVGGELEELLARYAHAGTLVPQPRRHAAEVLAPERGDLVEQD